jgi:hypothetical protein
VLADRRGLLGMGRAAEDGDLTHDAIVPHDGGPAAESQLIKARGTDSILVR